MKVLSDFHLKNEIPRAFYHFNFSFTSTINNGGQKCIVKIMLINILGFQVLMLNSGIKHAFKYEKRQ